jgi:hypothetical protein
MCSRSSADEARPVEKQRTPAAGSPSPLWHHRADEARPAVPPSRTAPAVAATAPASISERRRNRGVRPSPGARHGGNNNTTSPRIPSDVKGGLGQWWGSRRRVQYPGASEWKERESEVCRPWGRRRREKQEDGRGTRRRGYEGDRDRANDKWDPPVRTYEKRGRSNPYFNIR